MTISEYHKAGYKPPHAEISIAFWTTRTLARQLEAMAHRLHTNKSEVIRDALWHYIANYPMARATDAPQMNDHDNRRPL